MGTPTWQEAKEDPKKMALRIDFIEKAWTKYCKEYDVPCPKCSCPAKGFVRLD